MNAKQLTKSILGVQLILALVLSALPFWLQPVCPVMPNGHHMSCYYSAWLVVGSAGLLFLIALAQLWLKCRSAAIGLSVLQIIIAVLTYAVPKRLIEVPYGINMETGKNLLFGICKHEGMACQHTFATTSWILLVVAVLALFTLMIRLLTKED